MDNIPGIDTTKALESFNGSKENLYKVLRSYLAGTRTKLNILSNYDKDNLKIYEIAVHGVKGTSFSIFADEIGTQAKDLEDAASAGDIDFIEKNNPILLKNLDNLLNHLEKMFAGIDSKKIKEKKDKPDPELLRKLMEACDIYDMMEAEAAIEEINSFVYESDNGLAEWLKLKTEEMNYDAITEKLKSIIN